MLILSLKRDHRLDTERNVVMGYATLSVQTSLIGI